MNSRIYVSRIIVCQKNNSDFYTFYMNSKITFVGKNSKGLRELILFKKFLKIIMKVIIMFFHKLLFERIGFNKGQKKKEDMIWKLNFE